MADAALPAGSIPTEAEIAVIEALAAEDEIIMARHPSGVQGFRTRLLFVDPQRKFLLILASTDSAASAALLNAPSAILRAESGEWRIEITADNPQPTVHEGVRAIRLAFPRSVEIKRRRMLERTPVPSTLVMRCAAFVGGEASFRGTVTDISRGGIGVMQDFSQTPLHAGDDLPGCHLERPGRDPVIVDLKVRFTVKMMREPGQPGLKIGCQFVDPSAQALGLIDEFAGKGP